MEKVNNPEGIRIITNSGWLFSDKIVRQGLNLLLTAYIARYLGAPEFGQWNYAIAFVTLFSFFSSLGLYNILLRDFVRFPEKAGEMIGSAMVLRLFGGCLTLLFSVVTIFIFKPSAPALHILIFVVSTNYIAQSTDVFDFYFQSRLKSNWIAIARGISFIIFAIIKLALVHFKFTIAYFAAAQTAEFLLSGLLMFFFLQRVLPLKSIKVNRSLMKALIRDSAPIILAEMAIIIYVRTDQVMIGEMIGDRAVGNYSVAVRLSEIWYFIPGIICSSLFPLLVGAHSQNNERYQFKLQQLYDLLAGLSVGIAVVVSVTSYWIIDILFGPDFSEAASVLTIHIWAGVFVFWGLASNQQLVIEKLTNLSLYRTLTGMVVNVLLNFILIPPFGIKGAAIATLMAQASSTWLSCLFFKQTRPIFWMNVRSLNPLRFITLINTIFKKGFS